MDKIQFIITEPSESKKTNYKSCDVIVKINEEVLPHSFFNGNQVISSSNFQFVEFDLFTCSCGVPGCAGFQIPIYQKNNNTTVTWTFPEEDIYKTNKKVYKFDKQQFQESFYILYSNLLKLESEHVFLLSNFEDMEYEEDEENGFVAKETSPISIADGVSFWNKKFEAESKAHEIISEVLGDSFSNIFSVQYDGKQSKYNCSAYDLVCSVLNEFPQSKSDEEYYKKIKLTSEYLLLAIDGKNEAIYNTIKSSYSFYELEPIDFIARWFWDINESDNFDINKIVFIKD